MKKTILVTLCLLLGLFVSTAFAVEVTVLGPNQYLRTSGAPDVYTDTFSAIPGEGRLIVNNGAADGEHRITDAISSAVILVNGVQIFGPSDFNQQVYLLEIPVNLADSNSISVELASGPGSYLTIEVREEVAPPTVTLSADPGTIMVGESSTLTWNSTNADSCVIEPGIGSVDVSGSITVSPTETTTYTITATGLGGTATASVTVAVTYPPPTVNISANPVTIQVGESSTLTWSSTNADSCVIEPGIGSVDLNGSISVSPIETTTYTITVTGSGGSASADVNVAVIPLEIKLTASDAFYFDWFGESVSISGDYAIVGAYGDDDSGSNSGSAYIFKRDSPTWTQQAKLTAYDADTYDSFGRSVSISGDYAIVGATGEDDSGQNSGAACIFKRDCSTWTQQAKLKISSTCPGCFFGSSVSISSDYAIVGAKGYNQYSGSAYIFKREGSIWTQQAKLMASDYANYDWFGHSVSIDGDYAIVGACRDDDGGSSSGSVYIFKHDGSTWIEQAKLTAGDAAAGDLFGYSVSISGDYVILGAYGEDDSGQDSGSAYIFKREGSIWTQQAKLMASDYANYDWFGYSVSISGDYAIVGAYRDDDGGSDSGSAYIFKREGSIWTQQTKHTAGDAAVGDWFGKSVSIGGNYAIVGASYDDVGVYYNAGSAYIYPILPSLNIPTVNITADPETIQVGESSTLTWNSTHADSAVIDQGIGSVPASGSIMVSPTETTTYTITATGPDGTASANVKVAVIPHEIKLTTSDVAENDWFGYSVDINGDHAIVGASHDDDSGMNSGSAYIFTREGSIWTQQVKLTAGDTALGDVFGHSVSISGDYAIVGAFLDDDGGVSSGSAYIFKHDGSTWIEQAKLTASDAAAGDWFGYSVSISGDYAIVGAWCDDDAGYSSGSAYIFKREGFIWTQQAKLTAGDAAALEHFGYSVSISGDYAIVGAHADDEAGDLSGAAYIFKREGSIWTQQAKLMASDAAALDFFGASVSISGDYAVVGAGGDDDSGINSGSAYIFKRGGSIWTQQVKLTAGDAALGDGFGKSVSISGDYAIVGAHNNDDTGYSSGSAYIFKREGSVWTQHAKLMASDAAAEDRFGFSVSISGVYAIVGAYGDDDSGSNSGSAYFYHFFTDPVVNISSDPETIMVGESSTLTWSSTNVDSCVIEPDIGIVAVNGSTTVSPTETTTYTITATGPDGTATDSITVTVNYPPTAVIIADPETILAGESSTLTWSSTNADSCFIEPDIGSVNMSGSITVTPNETTTYTITATGPGGAVSDNVTVIVISLTVSISADPESILVGGSSVLTWSSTNADSVTIDQGIGSVDTIGSIPVSPDETTTYNITATGLGYTATASVTVTVTPIAISITSPLEGETINRPNTIVQGTITNLTGNETGVYVNGIVAMVYGDQFVANNVPLAEGENTITAVATDAAGYTDSASITVYSDITDDYIRVTAEPESGVSPLEVVLRAEGSFTPSNLSFTKISGPEPAEYLPGSEPNEIKVRLEETGVYYFLATAEDDQSNTYTDTVAVQVLDVAVLDALLKAKWNGMKTALIAEDIEGALNYIEQYSRETYQDIFNALGSSYLSSVAENMEDIQLIYALNGLAKYRIRRNQEINEAQHTITYYIYFQINGHGVWTIRAF